MLMSIQHVDEALMALSSPHVMDERKLRVELSLGRRKCACPIPLIEVQH